jgi:hypothetical protein
LSKQNQPKQNRWNQGTFISHGGCQAPTTADTPIKPTEHIHRDHPGSAVAATAAVRVVGVSVVAGTEGPALKDPAQPRS